MPLGGHTSSDLASFPWALLLTGSISSIAQSGFPGVDEGSKSRGWQLQGVACLDPNSDKPHFYPPWRFGDAKLLSIVVCDRRAVANF
jgi:hypothetical protein